MENLEPNAEIELAHLFSEIKTGHVNISQGINEVRQIFKLHKIDQPPLYFFRYEPRKPMLGILPIIIVSENQDFANATLLKVLEGNAWLYHTDYFCISSQPVKKNQFFAFKG